MYTLNEILVVDFGINLRIHSLKMISVYLILGISLNIQNHDGSIESTFE